MQGVITSLQTICQSSAGSINSSAVGATFTTEDAGFMESTFGLETKQLNGEITGALEELGEHFDSLSVEDGSLTESMRAGMIIAVASMESPGKYHQAALKCADGNFSSESLNSGVGGNINVISESDNFTVESFDETELRNFAGQNILFNVLASQQDAVAEALFPTKVVSPSEGGVEITVDRQEVIQYGDHPTDGSVINIDRKNLLAAFADASILSAESTELIPYARVDNTADANFVPDAVIGTVNRTIGDVSVPTRPLLIGKQMNLLGLSQHPGLIDNGILNASDQISNGAKLKTIYIQMTTAAEDGIGDGVISFNVSNLTRNQFKKSAEGSGREMVLNFITETLVATSTTTLIDDATLLNTILTTISAGTIATATLGVSLQGNLDLSTGTLSVNASDLHVSNALNAAGESISVDPLQAQIDGLTQFKVVGYDLEARRSNSNWRTDGNVIDSTKYTESHAIPMGYPISVIAPVDDTQTGSKISAMVNAARIRNSNNAITTLINYAEQLETAKTALAAGVHVDIVGAGAHIVTPYFDSEVIDIQAGVTNISSAERGEDVAYVIISAIRDAAFKMYRESNYGPALDIANAGMKTKAKVVIVCDAVVERYLTLPANEKLLGGEMEYEIASTNDSRMNDSIYLTFTRNRPGSEDGLTFGVHGFIPEMIQRVNVSLNGATTKNDRVIPRSIHIPVLPVLHHITVSNLTAAINNIL